MTLRWIGAPGAAVLLFVLAAPGSVTLQFGGGRASGSDGCNRFAGGFEADAKALQFSRLAATQMACAPEVMAQASAVMGALMATRAYRDTGERLELRAADGTLMISARRAAPAP